MSSMETLYHKLPISLQNTAVSFEGWRIVRRRYGKGYMSSDCEVKSRDRISLDELHAWRTKKLREFFIVASDTVFWHQKFSDYGVNPEAKDSFRELSKLPVLTKESVKKNIEIIKNPRFDPGSVLWRHTSGTTGSGLVFPESRETEWLTWAHWWRYRRSHGIEPSMWCGYFGGRSLVPLNITKPPYWRINYPARQLMFSGYHLSQVTASAYLDALQKYAIGWLHGYPSMLTLLAHYLLDSGQQQALPRLRIVTTGAENLADWQRDVINRAFGVPVFQHYGQAEAVANFSECEFGKMHVDEDFSAVEFLDNPHDLSSKIIVGTNWLNPSFPLFRYEVGDLAMLGIEKCSCGRYGRLVKSIDGRREDYLLLPSGVRIGRLDHVFKDMINVREAQFVQRDTHSVILRIARSSAYSDLDEQRLLKELHQRIGGALDVKLDYVDSIPRGKNGKLRFVLSSLDSNNCGMKI